MSVEVTDPSPYPLYLLHVQLGYVVFDALIRRGTSPRSPAPSCSARSSSPTSSGACSNDRRTALPKRSSSNSPASRPSQARPTGEARMTRRHDMIRRNVQNWNF
jgi:hypothetical protein